MDLNEKVYLIEGINPEPWQASEGSVGRKGGKTFVMFHKPAGLRAYQEAIQEEFQSKYADVEPVPGGDPIALEFFFWRELPQYEGDARKIRRHVADATNMQKALEDALQGLLFVNDRDVQIIKSTIVEQSFDAKPKILIILGSPSSAELDWANRLAAGHASPTPPEPEKYDRPDQSDIF